jgi:DNA-binding response OmpR family regulator
MQVAYLMVVDDDVDISAALEVVLKNSGYEVEVALKTEIAWEKLEERIPDLMVLDVMFPGNDSEGFEFARKIRGDNRFKSLPIVMMTAVNQSFPFGFSADDIDNEWLPVSEFLEKPVDFEVLKAKIEALLKK